MAATPELFPYFITILRTDIGAIVASKFNLVSIRQGANVKFLCDRGRNGLVDKKCIINGRNIFHCPILI